MSVLLLPAADEEQLPRLDAFAKRHPEAEVVIVGYPGAGGTWQAVVPEPDGSVIVVRYTLGKLLDRLEPLLEDQ